MSKSGYRSFRSLVSECYQLVVFKFRSLKQQTLPFFPVIFALSSHRAAISRAGARMKHYYKSLSFWSRIIQTVPPLFPKSPICSIKSTFTKFWVSNLSTVLASHFIPSKWGVSVLVLTAVPGWDYQDKLKLPSWREGVTSCLSISTNFSWNMIPAG